MVGDSGENCRSKRRKRSQGRGSRRTPFRDEAVLSSRTVMVAARASMHAPAFTSALTHGSQPLFAAAINGV